MAPAKAGQWTGPLPPEMFYMDFALEGWRKHPDKVAVIDINSGQELTFRQLEDRVKGFAGSLQALGIRPRSKVQYFANNCLNALIAQQAALFCSATVFFFKPNPALKYAEYRFQTNDSEAELIITDAVNYDMVVHELLTEPDCHVEKVIIVEGIPHKTVPEGKIIFLHQLTKREFIHPTDVRIREDAVAVLYTSGSTGMPKGVMHSHYTLVATLHNLGLPAIELYRENDRFLVSSLLAYATGIVFCGGTLSRGGTVIVGNPNIEEDFPIYIEKYQATVFILYECSAKTLMNKAHKFPNSKAMVSSLRIALVGGTVFPEHLRSQVTQFMGNIPFKNGYGMTESFGPICYSKESPEFISNVGFLAPHLEAKILNDAGKAVEIDEVGELLWRGPQRSLGYWKRLTDDFTSDGFFATGDMVCVDCNGNLTVVDRKKHFINCLGKRVSPTEIEHVLLQHPAVKEAIVVATLHPLVTEAPTAMVVLHKTYNRAGTLDDLSHELVSHIASRLSENKRLYGGVYFVESLAQTDSGKYARNEIKKQAIDLARLTS